MQQQSNGRGLQQQLGPRYTHQEVARSVRLCCQRLSVWGQDLSHTTRQVCGQARDGPRLSWCCTSLATQTPYDPLESRGMPAVRDLLGNRSGKLIRYKLFLIFQILFKPRPAAQLQAVHGSELRAASSAHRRGPRARGSPLPAQGLSSQPHPTNISPGSQERRAREGCSHQPAPQETGRSTAELQVKQRASLTLCYRHTNRMLTRKDNLGYETPWMRLPRNGSARAKSAGATACHGT